MKKIILLIIITSLVFPSYSLSKTESENKMMTYGAIALTISFGIIYISKFFRTNYEGYKEEQWRYIRYIAEDNEKKLYDTLHKKDDIDIFVKKFWEIRDLDNNLETNEFREQFEIRLAYARKNYKKGNGLNDRGRIYLKYGQPDEIKKDMNPEITINDLYYRDVSLREISMIEVWLYYRTASRDDSESYFYDIEPGMMKFVFVDIGGYGDLKQVYSTEEGEKIDSRFLK